jgi:hypothetical protein
MSNKEQLIQILLDSTATDSDKDDAAIQLGEYNDDDVIDILIKVANDPLFDENIRSSCGESLALIWLNKREINIEKFLELKGMPLREAISIIKSKRPDWYRRLIGQIPPMLRDTL